MDPKLLVALAGIIVSALSAELNDSVTTALLGDISGGLGFSHDAGTWFGSLYTSAEVFGMSVSPWFLVTLSYRRWALFVIALTPLTSVLVPFAPNLSVLYGLRALQGLCEGLTIPLLFTVALRALPPPIRLYGLAVYSLTATVFPSLSQAVAALWEGNGDSVLGWRFAFWESVPLAAVAFSLMWWGMPQDPPQHDRFRVIDWRGMLLSLIGFGAFSTLLQQGDRLDWFNSVAICILALVSAVAIPLFLVNEWFHKVPLVRLQLLGRRNLAYGVIALFTFVVIGLSGSTLPGQYLQQVQGDLPVQAYVLTALVACSQLVLLPLMALILDVEWIDARIVQIVGLGLVLAGCIGDSFLTSAWMRGEFFLWQGLISVGQAAVVMSLLMLSTNMVKPPEGPYASGLVNTPRALAGAVGVWLVQLISRWRGGLHSSRLADQAGQGRFVVGGPLGGSRGPPPGLADLIRQQGQVLALSDAFLIMAAIAGALMLLALVLPVRTPPPRIALAQH